MEENTVVNAAFVIDQSGSMYPMADSVINGFNKVLKDQSEKNTVFTVCMFNDKISYEEIAAPADRVDPLDKQSYSPDGSTALNDAIGKTIELMEKLAGKDGKVLFFVITDGMENASKYYSDEDIRNAVNRKNGDGWEFIFMGANINAAAEAQKRGIRKERSSDFIADSQGSDVCFDAVSSAMRSVRAEGIKDDWNKDIKKDYKKRSQK